MKSVRPRPLQSDVPTNGGAEPHLGPRELRGLSPSQARDLRRAADMLWPENPRRDPLMAGVLLLELSRSAPDHPEVLRWRGIRHLGLGEWQPAADCLTAAAALRPDDFRIHHLLSRAQDAAGAPAAALDSLRSAASLAVGAQQCFALSTGFDALGRYGDALAGIEQALRIDPGVAVFLLQRARCHKALGHGAEAAADCRTLIARDALPAQAWFALLDLKTIALSGAEQGQLQRCAERVDLAPADRGLIDFALGKALEDAGRHEAALAAFDRANRRARAGEPWDADAFARQTTETSIAFGPGCVRSADVVQGGELIFLVGLPRSGTTLVEQVLASHSRVEGASELPYLRQVVDAESRRRGQRFPHWVADATPTDWTRLGQDYLRLSARWRADKPVSTDKMPENWLLAGAIRAMLPAARIVDCRRSPLETCWSCYKQRFAPGLASFSHDFGDLAAYWHAYDGLCRQWAAQHPAQFRVQHYEALVRAPEAEIRDLLAFCALPFEPGCLTFHDAQRAIRTPSALQVRQPLKTTSTPAAGYASLLDPLRSRLAPLDAAGSSCTMSRSPASEVPP